MTRPALEVMQGDVRARLSELPDDHFHCAVTSPPYWKLRSYLPKGSKLARFELGSEPTFDAWVANMVATLREVRRVLRPDGTLWLNLGDSYNTNEHGPGSKRTGVGRTPAFDERPSARRCAAFTSPRPGTSAKGACPACGAPWVRELSPASGGSIGKSWNDHAKDAKEGNAKRAPSKGYTPGKTIGWAPTCRCGTDETLPCAVLDPFFGSGTTGEVALDLGRSVVGIELNPKHARFARERCAAAIENRTGPNLGDPFPETPVDELDQEDEDDAEQLRLFEAVARG